MVNPKPIRVCFSLWKYK